MNDETAPKQGHGADAPSVADCAGYALTGEFLGVELSGVNRPAELVAALARAGWPPQRVATVRNQRRHESAAWPMSLPKGIAAPGGFAQFHAWVSEAVAELGLDSHDAGVRDASQPIDAETRRLMADLPPHYGSAG